MNDKPRITFDPVKNEANIDKHGLPLSVAAEVIFNEVCSLQDTRFGYGEDRFVTFGYVGNRLHVAVWMIRDDLVRAISVRKANKREQERYG